MPEPISPRRTSRWTYAAPAISCIAAIVSLAGAVTTRAVGSGAAQLDAVICAEPGTTVTLAASRETVADCSGKITAAKPITVQAPPGTSITFDPTKLQNGTFAAVTLTLAGQGQTFIRTPSDRWVVQ